MVRSIAVVALASALLSGCWPVPGQNADRTSYNPSESHISVSTVGSLEEDWTAHVDIGAVGAPVLSVGRVHVTDGNALYAFDVSTGGRLWKTTIVDSDPWYGFSMGATFVEGDQVAANAVFHVLGGGGITSMVDAATGELDRTIGTGGLQSVRSPKGAGISITAGTDLPQWTSLVDVDLATGATTSSYLDFSALNAQVTVGRHAIYETGYGPVPPYGEVVIENPPASWQTFQQKGQAIRSFGAGARSCLPEGTLPDPNLLLFYNCGTWATPLDGVPTAPVIGPGEAVLYVGTSAGTLYAVDAATGAVQWSTPVGAGVSAPPALANGQLYVPTSDGHLVVLDTAGTQVWSASTAGSPFQPAVAGGVVFTASTTGNLRAFDATGCGASTCDPLWSASTGSAITGAPAVSGGRLFIPTEDGRLISYR
jgi:outer membrane protein assembly factor BamB